MAWFPTKESINKEVQNYENISFFKKSKNLLICLIMIVVLSTFLLAENLKINNYAAIIAITYNLVLAIFIYNNHRWAMVIFCIIYSVDKTVFILSGQSVLPNLFFGILAIILTITAYRVSSDLKKLNR